jgi:hypothetical protein
MGLEPPAIARVFLGGSYVALKVREVYLFIVDAVKLAAKAPYPR